MASRPTSTGCSGSSVTPIPRVLRGEVAERCIHRAPDVTRMLDRLVRQRLAKRTRAAADRRCSVATITKAGLALLARMDDEVTGAIRTLTKPLSLPELQHLTRLTDALTR